jgi:hypothetical protein
MMIRPAKNPPVANMVAGDKIVFVKTVPECATFAEIPSGVPAVVAKWTLKDPKYMAYLEEQTGKGLIYIRIQGAHLGYVPGNQWFYLFVPMDSVGPRHNFN